MNNNYFTSLYIAHAVLRCWFKQSSSGSKGDTAPQHSKSSNARVVAPPPARHLIFTASFLAFYSFAGYTAYSPCKAALRSLSDTLSQEVNLYNASAAATQSGEPPVRLHTGFPATIFTESYEAETRIKSDLTKMLEEGDEGQTPQVVARKSIRALEGGQELVTTDILTALVKRGALGGSVRGGFLRVVGDWLLACLMGLVMVFVRDDMDRKVRAWGRKHGTSGMKEGGK